MCVCVHGTPTQNTRSEHQPSRATLFNQLWCASRTIYVLDTFRNEKHNLRFLTSLLLLLPDDVRAKILLRGEEEGSSTLHFDKTTIRSLNVQRAQVHRWQQIGCRCTPTRTQNIITKTIDTKCASNEQTASKLRQRHMLSAQVVLIRSQTSGISMSRLHDLPLLETSKQPNAPHQFDTSKRQLQNKPGEPKFELFRCIPTHAAYDDAREYIDVFDWQFRQHPSYMISTQFQRHCCNVLVTRVPLVYSVHGIHALSPQKK